MKGDQCDPWPCSSEVRPSAVPPVDHRMQTRNVKKMTGTTTNGEEMCIGEAPCL